jgi:hypothetical protein
MKDEIAAALQPLIGLRFWDAGRAVEIKKFAFGDERILQGRTPPRLAGEWELHLMCAWRLIGREGLLVGSADMFSLVDEDQDKKWDEAGGNMSDLRTERVFSKANLVVQGLDVQSHAGITVQASDDIALEVWPNSWSGEQWRLFVPGTSTNHFVVETIGGVLKAGWE